MPRERVMTTGYPRNDYLIEHREGGDPGMLTRYPFLAKRTILYAPTYRSQAKVRFLPFDDLDMGELESFLKRNDAYLIMRTHHADDAGSSEGAAARTQDGGSRIVTLNRDLVKDVQDLLPFVDIMISDYSGVWLDYLLLDRPVVFVPYDLEFYEASEGLLYEYNKITPGPKVFTFADFMRELEAYIAVPSKDAEMRGEIRRMFHEFDDGGSYERILSMVREAVSAHRP